MYEFFQSLGQKIINAVGGFFSWLGGVFSSLFNAIKEFFAMLFRPVILFFTGLWYLLEKCFDIVVLTIQVVFGLFKVLISIAFGIVNTFTQLLGFSGSTEYFYMPGAYQQGWDGVVSFFNNTGLGTIALIMAAFIWMGTAYAVIKIAGGER